MISTITHDHEDLVGGGETREKMDIVPTSAHFEG